MVNMRKARALALFSGDDNDKQTYPYIRAPRPPPTPPQTGQQPSLVAGRQDDGRGRVPARLLRPRTGWWRRGAQRIWPVPAMLSRRRQHEGLSPGSRTAAVHFVPLAILLFVTVSGISLSACVRFVRTLALPVRKPNTNNNRSTGSVVVIQSMLVGPAIWMAILPKCLWSTWC